MAKENTTPRRAVYPGRKENGMTSKEAERKIYEHMREIRRIHKGVCKSDDYLALCIDQNGKISFNNSYWELPDEEQITFYEEEEQQWPNARSSAS